MRKRIAVIGSNGFVGSTMVKALERSTFATVKVTRETDPQIIQTCSHVIHCANSASRYNAELYPESDKQDSLIKTQNFLSRINSNQTKFILISSISARTEPHTIYGQNRLDCEKLVVKNGGYFARLGYMYSTERIYGALKDILSNQAVYLDKESRYSYSNVNWNAEKIIELFIVDDNRRSVELGCKGSISLGEIASILDSRSEFIPKKKDVQIANDEFVDQPSIREFCSYLMGLKRKKNEITNFRS
jgi:dTDP-4-dehydrorhamnose reductase